MGVTGKRGRMAAEPHAATAPTAPRTLIGRLTAVANRRRHIIVIAPAGCRGLRVLAESAIIRRGWIVAQNPAEADGLLLVGQATGPLDEVVTRVWDQLAGPRARESTSAAGDLDAALDRMTGQWSDHDAQTADARRRDLVGAGVRDDEPADDKPGDDTRSEDKHDHDHDVGVGMGTGMDMDMDMDMDMSGPAGIPLASGSDADRDGLEMDVLNITLGPVLPSWPDGLVVRGTLSGDVITAVTTEVLGAATALATDNAISTATGHTGTEHARVVGVLDDIARLLSLAGWTVLADRTLRMRDEIATGADPNPVALARLRRSVRRAPVLRWSLARSGSQRLRASVDLNVVLETWLARLDDGAVEHDHAPVRSGLAGLPALLEGLELSDVRLVVAALSLDAELAELAALAEPTTRPEGTHA